MNGNFKLFSRGAAILVMGLVLISTLIIAGPGRHRGHPIPSPTVTPTPAPIPHVTLAWDASPDPSVTGYTLWMGFTSGGENKGMDEGLALVATVQLQSATTYFFVVKAHNSAGESPPSNEVSYTAP